MSVLVQHDAMAFVHALSAHPFGWHALLDSFADSNHTHFKRLTRGAVQRRQDVRASRRHWQPPLRDDLYLARVRYQVLRIQTATNFHNLSGAVCVHRRLHEDIASGKVASLISNLLWL